MTLRAKPVAKRPGRPGREGGDRRNFLINVAFVVSIALAILLLIGYAAFSYYDAHFGAAATVEGTVITRDQLRARVTADNFRIDYTEGRIRTLQTAGRLTETTASQELSYLEQIRNSLGSVALERLIDVTIQAKLATAAGIDVTDADVDARLLVESTSPEERHTFVIEVAPRNDPATGKPGDAQRAASKAIAQIARDKLTAGAAWDDIAKATSTAASAPQAGDLGWLPADSGFDKPFMAAIYGAAVNTLTDVIEGDDGIYRIGRYTESAPAQVDPQFATKLDSAGVKVADFRAVLRGDVVRQRLNDKIVADLSRPAKQRHVLQIFLPEITAMPDGVKVRHILYAPNDDPAKAKDLAATDPGWAKAEAEAKAAYALLTKDPSKFDELARTVSDEGSAAQTGGKQPFYDAASLIDSAFAAAIFAPGLKPGDLLPPFKSGFGWHVVQFLRPYGDGDKAWLETLKQQVADGADFGSLARDQGEGPEARVAGDIDWLATGQLDTAKETPIFATTVGSTSAVTEIPGDGAYLWFVVSEEVRSPTKAQLSIYEQSGFSNWYSDQKSALEAAGKITRSAATSGVTQ